MNVYDDDGDGLTYQAVVNIEGQYSIWPVDREMPIGWSDAGKSGTKADCLQFIDEVWTDMTPLSLRSRGGARRATAERLARR